MEIKAADVMKLRKMTGAGMMDCKKALQEAEGDFDRAKGIIREKGKLVVAKRSDRTATEGVVVTKIVGQKGYILCLACETDFVAQNEEFGASANAMLEIAVAADAAISIDENDCPAEVVEKERTFAIEQMKQDPKNANKPEAILEKIAEGKMRKFFEENTLLNQCVVGEKESIREFIQRADKEATVVAYKRFALEA